MPCRCTTPAPAPKPKSAPVLPSLLLKVSKRLCLENFHTSGLVTDSKTTLK